MMNFIVYQPIIQNLKKTRFLNLNNDDILLFELLRAKIKSILD